MPKADASNEHSLSSVIIREKKPLQFPKEEKASYGATVLKAAGAAFVDGVDAVGDGIFNAGAFVADSVVGIGILAKRAVGKKDVMPRRYDDLRAKRGAYLLSFLLAAGAVFGVYKVYKHYKADESRPAPITKPVDCSRAKGGELSW